MPIIKVVKRSAADEKQRQLFRQYDFAKTKVRQLRHKHSAVLGIIEDAEAVVSALESQIQEHLHQKSFAGEHVLFTGESATVVVQGASKREVDSCELEKLFPSARNYGLIKEVVVLAKLDALIESGELAAKDIDAITDRKPTTPRVLFQLPKPRSDQSKGD